MDDIFSSLEIGEVRNFEDDPTKSGRVRVRTYNKHNDEQEIPDDDLPWAMVMHPITSPATAKMGISPSGLIVGSRVLLCYLPEDTAKQYPIVLGSLARGDKPEGSDKDNGGVGSNSQDAYNNSGGKHKRRGPDNPGYTADET